MNILYINVSDIQGGAAIGGYRLHRALQEKGIQSRMLVDVGKINNNDISIINRKRTLEYLTSKVTWNLGLSYINITSTFNITEHPFYKKADLINFHCLHGGYFNYLAIPKLTRDKPGVYRLSDMWSFTGHCAYSFDCERWKIGCGKCPYLDTYPAIPRDNTKLEFRLKKWVYNHSNLTIVTSSQWLTEKARESMLNHFNIKYIPNGIDTEIYKPLNKIQCRNVLDIPQNKNVILLVAQNLTNYRKGGDILLNSINNLPESLKKETILITMGESGEVFKDSIGMSILNLGYIGGDRLKAVAYNAADLFLFPTRAESFGLVLLESMACGTPMVSFNVGGVPDLVRHDVTGYLAKPEDAQDFCNGIIQLLEDDTLRNQISQNCRAIALQEYPIELQAKRYIELYEEILAN